MLGTASRAMIKTDMLPILFSGVHTLAREMNSESSLKL